MKTNTILNGDVLTRLRELPENSVDAIITDPPYGLGFMNKEWDNPEEHRRLVERERQRSEERFKEGKSPTTAPFTSSVRPGLAIKGAKEGRWYQEWFEIVCRECLRVLKPGGYLLSFGGTRTYHRMTCGIEDAGFEIRDCIMWIYGSGFPKSLNIGKQIDKMPYRIEREKIKNYLAEWINKSDKSKKQIDKECGFRACAYTRISYRDDDGWGSALPTEEKWKKMKEVIGFDNTWDEFIKEAERQIIGKKKTGFFEKNEIFEQDNEGYGTNDITLPETDSANSGESPR